MFFQEFLDVVGPFNFLFIQAIPGDKMRMSPSEEPLRTFPLLALALGLISGCGDQSLAPGPVSEPMSFDLIAPNYPLTPAQKAQVQAAIDAVSGDDPDCVEAQMILDLLLNDDIDRIYRDDRSHPSNEYAISYEYDPIEISSIGIYTSTFDHEDFALTVIHEGIHLVWEGPEEDEEAVEAAARACLGYEPLG